MDSYVYVITALLLLAALMLVLQVNPYHALVIRGILGAIAALVYTVLGAADVALTEALVGTLLASMLYAVAVRSSLVVRLGVLKQDMEPEEAIDPTDENDFRQLLKHLRRLWGRHHLHLEVVFYADPQELQQALVEEEVHITCVSARPTEEVSGHPLPCWQVTTRLRRLYELMQPELSSPLIQLTCANPIVIGEVKS